MKRSVKMMTYCIGLTALTSTIAIACSMEFPWQLLDNRKETLLTLPDIDSFAQKATQLVQVTVQEKQNLYAQIEQDQRLNNDQSRICPNTDDTYKQAALLFHNKQWEDAYLPFTQLAYNSPPAQKVCAQYSLGFIENALGKKEDAVQSFTSTAYLVAHGAPDPLHLGMDSYGQAAGVILDQLGSRTKTKEGQIQWQVGEVKPDSVLQLVNAINLYAKQAALGYDGGIASLVVVIDGLSDPNNPNAVALLNQAVSERLVRQLLLAYVLNNNYLYKPTSKAQIKQIFQAFSKAVYDKKDMGKDMALLAAFAYQNHDIEHAEQWAKYDWDKYQKSVDAWILAKISLIKGDRKQAQDYYHQAILRLRDGTISLAAQQRIKGEQAVLTLAQGGFVQALEQLWPVRDIYWGDVVYLAENVLTPQELKDFVDTHTREALNIKYSFCNRYNMDEDKDRLNVRSVELRHLLARRLARIGQIQEALPYYQNPGDGTCKGWPKHVRIEKSYIRAVYEMRHNFWATDRAKAAWNAATILRDYGMELMGTDGYPDQNPGGFSYGYSQMRGPKNDLDNREWGSDKEQIRTGASWPIPNRRFHYRYLAVEDVLYAASLIPPQSQAYAALLCHANGWMQNTSNRDSVVIKGRDLSARENVTNGIDDSRFAYAKSKEIYNLYLRTGAVVSFADHFGYSCPQPEFNKIPALKRKLFWKNIHSSFKFLKGGS